MAKIETTLTEAQVRIAEAILGGNYAVTIGKRSGDTISRAVPLGDFPLASIQSIVNYGVQRRFNDAVGGKDKTKDDKVKIVDQMLEAFAKGDVGRARAVGVDALTSEIRIIMRQLVKAEMGAEEYKVASNVDGFDESLDAVFDEQDDDTKAAITAAAEEALEAKRKARDAKAGLKLGGLGKLTK